MPTMESGRKTWGWRPGAGRSANTATELTGRVPRARRGRWAETGPRSHCAPGRPRTRGEQPGTQRTGPQNSASRHFGVKFKSEREVHNTKISNVKTRQTRSLNFGSGSEAVPVRGPVASAPPRPHLGDTGHGQTWNQDFPDPGFFAGSCAPPGRGGGAACPAQAGALAPRSGVDPDHLPPQGPTVTARRHLPS